MAESKGYNQSFSQNQSQKQQQTFKMSQQQIQAVTFLEMGISDLREEIYKFAAENPALEIVGTKKTRKDESFESYNYNNENYGNSSRSGRDSSEAYQRALESREDKTETLQAHLMHQLNSINLSGDEYELSQKLIYNLDKNGCYGSMIAPEKLLDKTRPLQTVKMLERCIERIQKMDPIGVCCRNPEESLFIQAKVLGDASPLTLFLLNGHLDFLAPPESEKVLKKVLAFRNEWHKKAFATELPIDAISLSEKEAEDSIKYILQLNPRPASGYISDSTSEYEMPDIVLTVEKIPGAVYEDDFSHGVVSGDDSCHFQIKYASGVLPEVRIAQDFLIDKESVEKARIFINNLKFRESTIILQGCAIVRAQKEFFVKGPGHILPLTRHQIAEELNIHESTVSRMANKKNSKYIQTEYGLYPASYFFSSGVKSVDGKENVSAEAVKMMIAKILEEKSVYNKENTVLSDNKLTQLLNEKGIKIARRTVAKYRAQLGLENSYKR